MRHDLVGTYFILVWLHISPQDIKDLQGRGNVDLLSCITLSVLTNRLDLVKFAAINLDSRCLLASWPSNQYEQTTNPANHHEKWAIGPVNPKQIDMMQVSQTMGLIGLVGRNQ